MAPQGGVPDVVETPSGKEQGITFTDTDHHILTIVISWFQLISIPLPQVFRKTSKQLLRMNAYGNWPYIISLAVNSSMFIKQITENMPFDCCLNLNASLISEMVKIQPGYIQILFPSHLGSQSPAAGSFLWLQMVWMIRKKWQSFHHSFHVTLPTWVDVSQLYQALHQMANEGKPQTSQTLFTTHTQDTPHFPSDLFSCLRRVYIAPNSSFVFPFWSWFNPLDLKIHLGFFLLSLSSLSIFGLSFPSGLFCYPSQTPRNKPEKYFKIPITITINLSLAWTSISVEEILTR